LIDCSEVAGNRTHETNQPEHNFSQLRRKWQQAVADNSEGLDREPVFARLENKLNGMIEAEVR
jgi:hypothetical protein